MRYDSVSLNSMIQFLSSELCVALRRVNTRAYAVGFKVPFLQFLTVISCYTDVQFTVLMFENRLVTS